MDKHYETIQNLMIFFMKLVINIKFYLCDMLIFNVVIICRKENPHYLRILFFHASFYQSLRISTMQIEDQKQQLGKLKFNCVKSTL